MKHLKTLIILFAAGLIPYAAAAKSQVVKLVCEYHQNPIGIDVEKPRFSWQIVSDEENVLQSADEIRVAESAKNLSRKSAQLWNSGKVECGISVNVEYGGSALKSMQRAYWQVRIWDNNGKATKWSEPALFEMGILEPETWAGSWITLNSEKNLKKSQPAHFYRN